MLFETLKALNPNLWAQCIAYLLQHLSLANQLAYASSYHSCSLLDDIQPWKPRTEEIDCKPGIPSRYEGSLFRWITNLIYNCKDQEGTCFLPERIQDQLFDLVPAYDFRNQRPPATRTSDEWVKRGQDDCLFAIDEGNTSLAAIGAIWLYRLAHAQHPNILGHPELSQRRKTTYHAPEFYPHVGYMVSPLMEVHQDGHPKGSQGRLRVLEKCQICDGEIKGICPVCQQPVLCYGCLLTFSDMEVCPSCHYQLNHTGVSVEQIRASDHSVCLTKTNNESGASRI